jgi:hypothetical protein
MYVCWLLHSFSNQSKDTMLDGGPNIFLFETSSYAIFYNAWSHKNAAYCVVAQLTVFKILSTCNITDPWVSIQSSSFQETLCTFMF